MGTLTLEAGRAGLARVLASSLASVQGVENAYPPLGLLYVVLALGCEVPSLAGVGSESCWWLSAWPGTHLLHDCIKQWLGRHELKHHVMALQFAMKDRGKVRCQMVGSTD